MMMRFFTTVFGFLSLALALSSAGASSNPCHLLAGAVPEKVHGMLEVSDGTDAYEGKSIIYYAAVLGRVGAVDAWVSEENWRSLDPDIFSGAVIAGQVEVVNVLLNSGVDPDWRDSNGATALLAAAACERLDMVELLIEAGADVNAHNNDGLDPLIQAIVLGDIDIVLALLNAGFDLSQSRLVNGLGPRDVAERVGNDEILKLLYAQ
ncbi:hypothetical protein CAI21_17235 [Alkalilimnicola ehrlichii]|uniref:Uncharacterized protein n=1 Tax=Alkalilimnicola ehrlichii TaxID=351052 RepID=A0A3E0WM39_9GAMM|nr:ankyrin repeat domain-containing protein [Alkalilimnicola ehrlichii]RFA26225.1 hypothetical protein CAI21_17235 [Alkalilimnicola ehrlichii]RFA33211.1 hypothetical protein CAL65_17725 [Alkalilimnicola ehrlichii]